MDSDSFVWFCPSCGRRVPNRVGECRCGYHREAEPQEPFVAPQTADAPSSRGISARGTALIVIVVAAVAGLYLARPRPQTPAAGAPASDISAPVRADEPEAPPIPISDPSPAIAAPSFGETAPPAANPSTPPPAAPSSNTLSLEDIVGLSLPAVVSIEAGASRGTGFFISADTVLTNAHVVGGHAFVTLTVPGGAPVPGRVARIATELDLAIVNPSATRPDQPTLPLGSAAGVRVGQEVIAIGSALGVLQNTVTRGIVSAVRTAGPVTLIQTDAAINPGNSGGPLIDRTGHVIGVNTLKVGSNAESLGFAVAIDHALSIVSGRSVAASPSVAPSGAQPIAPFMPSQNSTADAMREEGAQNYERVVAGLARQADQVDDYWRRFKAACASPPGPATQDREWFVVWEKRPGFNAAVPECGAWITDIAAIADRLRTAMLAAEEAARRASVYPGRRREIRQKYRMDWRGWER